MAGSTPKAVTDKIFEEIKAASSATPNANADVPVTAPNETELTTEERVKRATGWNFSREYAEWKLYHETFVKRVVNKHLRERIGKVRDFFDLFILLISSFTTLVTAISSGIIGASDASDVVQDPDDTSLLKSTVLWLMENSQYILLVLSFLTSVASFFVKHNTAFWKRVEKDGRTHEVHLQKLEQFFRSNLEVVPADRMPFDKYLELRKIMIQEGDSLPDLGVPPALMTRAIRRVRQYGPSDWSRAFMWLGVDLVYPRQYEHVEMMLMEFSSELLGFWTRTPYDKEGRKEYLEAFRKEKKTYFQVHGLSQHVYHHGMCSWQFWLLNPYVYCCRGQGRVLATETTAQASRKPWAPDRPASLSKSRTQRIRWMQTSSSSSTGDFFTRARGASMNGQV